MTQTKTLPKSLFQLNVIKDLTYHQLLLIRVLELATTGEPGSDLPDILIGENPPPLVAEILPLLVDLFDRGVLHEDPSGAIEFGGLASRYDGTHISYTKPSTIRFSGIGIRLARNLRLEHVPDDELAAIFIRFQSLVPPMNPAND